jgi:hypothetical protein
MTRWAPWLLAFAVWNGAFDLQVRRAAESFTATQIDRWQREAPPELVRDALTPRVREAALRASAAAGGVLALGLVWTRRRAARPAYR